MKKLLLILTTSLSFVFAQQLYYYTDMIGSAGDQMLFATDTNVTLPPNPTADINFMFGGVSQSETWDFVGLDSDVVDTLRFFAPTSVEIASFPGCNLVTENNSQGRIFWNKNNATGLQALGVQFPFPGFGTIDANYNPGYNIIPYRFKPDSVFPLQTARLDQTQYIGVDTNVFGFAITIDSIRVKRTTEYYFESDASGTLELPLVNVPYAIRSKQINIDTDSIYLYCPSPISIPLLGIFQPTGWALGSSALLAFGGFGSNPSVDSTNVIAWYDPYSKFAICLLDYEVGVTDTTINSVQFLNEAVPNIGFETNKDITLSVFPNPASDIIQLNTTEDLTNTTFTIFNMQGQAVKSVILNSNTLSVNDLANGNYLYYLSKNRTLLKQGKLVVSK